MPNKDLKKHATNHHNVRIERINREALAERERQAKEAGRKEKAK